MLTASGNSWQTGSHQEICQVRLLCAALFLSISAGYSKCSLVVSIIGKKKSVNYLVLCTGHIHVPVINGGN